METHIELDSDHIKYAPADTDTPKEWFKKANEFAIRYYKHEIDRALSVRFDDLTPDKFFHEYIWVVHATGFSAKAVSKFIKPLIEAYGNYNTLASLKEVDCFPRILAICNNPQKAKSVKKTAEIMQSAILDQGWEEFKKESLNSLGKLEKLPYIGPVTRYHLGRNIGMLDCVKPDLHLIRMAKHWGYEDCEQMISDISHGYGYPKGISDMIAWYYASTFGTIGMKKKGDR
jgi:endonuclease III